MSDWITPDELHRRLDSAAPEQRLDVALAVIAELVQRVETLEQRVTARGF